MAPSFLRTLGILGLCVIPSLGRAQRISGTIPSGAARDGIIRLLVSRGSHSRPVDSATVAPDGRFAFRPAEFPLGFYQLGVNDSDLVDIILDPAERHVDLSFAGLPLRNHVSIVRSDENKRLWEYKLISREAQAVQASVDAEKRALDVNETGRMFELDSIAARAMTLRTAFLDGVVNGHPDSYFAKVIRTDQALEDARGGSPDEVLRVFDMGDPTLMRSSLYDKAVITYLRNIHASSEDQFVAASDTLLALAGRDPECRGYMLDHLIDLFAAYGPEIPLQHLIDAYVVSPERIADLDPSIRAKVAELIKVTVGMEAPDVDLPTSGRTVPLRSIVRTHPYTALFFYSSTCDHCHLQMPLVKEVYKAFAPKGLEVVGIALDPDSSEFRRTIAQEGLDWPCYSEFKGWGSEAAKAFQVKATPFFYLLDDRMRIVAKPVDAYALGDWLQEHLK